MDKEVLRESRAATHRMLDLLLERRNFPAEKAF